MAVRKGIDFHIEIETSSGTYEQLGALQSASLTLARELIDVTNYGSNEYSEKLSEAGIKNHNLTGSGTATDDDVLLFVRNAHISGALLGARVVQSGTAAVTYTGTWAVASFELAGEYNGAQTFNLSLESSGALTIT